MGCDIHIVLEQKDENKWIGVNTYQPHYKSNKHASFPVTTQRNYRRFAKLAGVRGDGPAPKGIPEDASDTYRLMVKEWGIDGHSHSWVSLREACNIWKETTEFLSDFADKYPECFFFNYNHSLAYQDKFRVVFFFDN